MSERMPWLVSKLRDTGCGRMGIVIGGGPSAPSDLKKIPGYEKAVIISANHHAFKLKLKPDYIWCKDHVRVFPGYMAKGRPREYMERELRRYGVPIIGPSFWCDYRAIDWPITQFNSGQQALAALVFMGCCPILPVGMDCFIGDTTYFHDKDAENISKGRKDGYWDTRIRNLKKVLPEAPIRGVSGLVAKIFGEYRLDRPLVPGPIPPLLQRYINMPTVWVETHRAFQDSRDKFATIPAKYILASNNVEAIRLEKLGLATRVQLFDS